VRLYYFNDELLVGEPMNEESRSSIGPTSFEDFVNHASASLLRTAYLITWNVPEAEDVVQEALLRVAARWNRVSTMEFPQAYARRVVVTHATEVSRKGNRHGGHFRGDTAETSDDVPDDRSEQPFALIDARSEILWLLAKLSRQQRAVLVLKYFEDMSESDVAATLSIPLGTVKSTSSRALERMRRALSDPSVDSLAQHRTIAPITRGS